MSVGGRTLSTGRGGCIPRTSRDFRPRKMNPPQIITPSFFLTKFPKAMLGSRSVLDFLFVGRIRKFQTHFLRFRKFSHGFHRMGLLFVADFNRLYPFNCRLRWWKMCSLSPGEEEWWPPGKPTSETPWLRFKFSSLSNFPFGFCEKCLKMVIRF